MRTGHAVNLYLSDETLRRLEKMIAHMEGEDMRGVKISKSELITELVNEEYKKWYFGKEEK